MGAIAGYLADGLIPTAFGLLIAIPALWCHRYLTNRMAAFETEMEQQAADLLFLLFNRSP